MNSLQLKESVVVSSVAAGEEGYGLVLAKLAAGAAACAVTHPADVVKTQMQLYPRQSPSLVAAAGHNRARQRDRLAALLEEFSAVQGTRDNIRSSLSKW